MAPCGLVYPQGFCQSTLSTLHRQCSGEPELFDASQAPTDQGGTYILVKFIATSHDRFPPKGSVLEGKWDPLFQGNLGWWNIIIWPEYWGLPWSWRKCRNYAHVIVFQITSNLRVSLGFCNVRLVSWWCNWTSEILSNTTQTKRGFDCTAGSCECTVYKSLNLAMNLTSIGRNLSSSRLQL